MVDKVVFRAEGEDRTILLTSEFAPDTLAALIRSLPAKLDIHCAKVAGSHIMWPVPFVERLEKAADVLTMAPGSFFYWPERQYLEITYAELQAESAAVSYLGKLEGDVDWLRDYADRNRREQGRRVFTAEMFVAGDVPTCSPCVPDTGEGALADLRTARIAVWLGQPDDVQALLDRRGLMIPFGPLSLAEGEMRKLHELLWRLWNDEARYRDKEKATIAVFAIEAAVARVAGFCHMTDVGAVLQMGARLLEDGDADVISVLEELVLYCGRIAAWLDLYICWWQMNEITLEAQGARQSQI